MSNVNVIYPHDPLCPAMNCIDSGCEDCCRCDLIAKVRHDTVAAAVKQVADYLQHDVADNWMPRSKADGIITAIIGEKP